MLVPYFIFQAHYYVDSFFHFYEILNYLLPFTSSFPTFWYVLKASVPMSVMCPFRSLVFINCTFISLSFCTFGLILSSRIWANSSFIWESIHWKIRSLFDQSHQSFINSLAEVSLWVCLFWKVLAIWWLKFSRQFFLMFLLSLLSEFSDLQTIRVHVDSTLCLSFPMLLFWSVQSDCSDQRLIRCLLTSSLGTFWSLFE